MVTVELMATYFQIVEPPLSTLLGVGLQIPLTIGVVDLEDEDATVVLLPGFTAELLDATDEVSAFIDEELPSADELEALMDRIQAPKTAADIGTKK